MKKKIICTVFNDLAFDQRMQRICSSLQHNGYDVVLIGRKIKGIPAPSEQPFKQIRLKVLFSKGFLLYANYNIRLFFKLLFVKADAVCAIDLDTILPVYIISKLKGIKRVYDAHELFPEMKEIVTRPLIHKFWNKIEKLSLPRFQFGYTVNEYIANEFKKKYQRNYAVIKNLPLFNNTTTENESFIIYQGAVNEGRSFETLIPAMQHVNAKLIVCGEGNFFEQTQKLIQTHNLQHKIELKGFFLPSELKQITPKARAAVMLFEATGLNQFHSLSNRFFDYIMAGVPQLCVNYPEYRKINDIYDVCFMIDDTSVESISTGLNKLISDDALHNRLKQNCLKARKELCWENEEKKLIAYWKTIL